MSQVIKKSIFSMAHAELAKHIHTLARDSKQVIFGKHAISERMVQRGISKSDVIKVLQQGMMKRAAEPSENYTELKCRMDGRDPDGDPIGVEVAVSDVNPNLIVITVIRYER